MKRFYSIRGTLRTYPGKKERFTPMSQEVIQASIDKDGEGRDPYIQGYNDYWNCEDYKGKPEYEAEWKKGWHDAEMEHAQQIKGMR